MVIVLECFADVRRMIKIKDKNHDLHEDRRRRRDILGCAPVCPAHRPQGPGQDTRRGTDHVKRPYQHPVPGPREVRTPHHPGGGGADAAGARAHTHAKGTRGLPEGQPDRARRTHRPRGMAYQRARVRDIRTGRPATRSTGRAGREGGNGRDTTPGTGSNPPDRPRAPRTHGRALRAHLDQVSLNYPSETVVQPSSTAHFHYGFPTVEPLSRYSNKLLSSNLKTAIFQPCKRCHTP